MEGNAQSIPNIPNMAGADGWSALVKNHSLQVTWCFSWDDQNILTRHASLQSKSLPQKEGGPHCYSMNEITQQK